MISDAYRTNISVGSVAFISILRSLVGEFNWKMAEEIHLNYMLRKMTNVEFDQRMKSAMQNVQAKKFKNGTTGEKTAAHTAEKGSSRGGSSTINDGLILLCKVGYHLG